MLILSLQFGAFDHLSPRTEFFCGTHLDGHGYIFSIFHPQVCAKALNRSGSARCGLRCLKGCQRLSRISASRSFDSAPKRCFTR